VILGDQARTELTRTAEDLRADRGDVDLVDETTGELLRAIPARIAVVSGNGPCFRSGVFTESFTGEYPLLRHVRT
jgi:putative transposase